ncbi:MAG: hypothetical protein QNK04_06405 [Myxococcota bacterium]|nr:hypothetical protein [Myxococcota bacterium]
MAGTRTWRVTASRYSDHFRQLQGRCWKKGASGMSSKKEKIFTTCARTSGSSCRGARAKPQLPITMVLTP